MQNSIRRR